MADKKNNRRNNRNNNDDDFNPKFKKRKGSAQIYDKGIRSYLNPRKKAFWRSVTCILREDISPK